MEVGVDFFNEKSIARPPRPVGLFRQKASLLPLKFRMEIFRRCVLSVITVMALTGLSFAGLDGWETDLEKAMEQAKKTKKNILIEFTGSDWCPPCIMMRNEVFSKKEFIEKASKDFILVELDFPKNDKALKEKNETYFKKYEVAGFPYIILLDSNSKEFARFFASEQGSIEKFLAHLNKSLERKDMD